MGEEPALELSRQLLDEALELLGQAGLHNGPLAELARLAVERKH